MLARLLPKPSHFRLLPLPFYKSQSYPSFPQPPSFPLLGFLSTNHNNNGNNGKDQSFPDSWKFSQDSEGKFGNLFSDDSGVSGSHIAASEEDDGAEKKSGEEDWLVGEEDKAWNFGEEDKDDGVFYLKERAEFGETRGEPNIALSSNGIEERKKLEEEEKQLTAILKGICLGE